jgi:predicted Zn-ribbon and HTH transcriptional regulator
LAPVVQWREDLGHAIRSAVAAGHLVEILRARCRTCGFTFDEQKLTKPGKGLSCRGSRLYQPQILVRSKD